MSRILVAFASTHGQTREIAHALATQLERRGHAVELGDAASGLPVPGGYDAVLIGSRVQTSKHAPPIVDYARRHGEQLARLPTGFFSVSMSAAQHGAGLDPNGYLEAFFKETGWRPGCAVAFGGALKYPRYNWFLRQAMRLVARRGGHSTDASREHVYTDWAAVARFADHFADGLRAANGRTFNGPASAGTAA
jgi:menaquinone-dependent protoporphyrinogen oxidase